MEKERKKKEGRERAIERERERETERANGWERVESRVWNWNLHSPCVPSKLWLLPGRHFFPPFIPICIPSGKIQAGHNVHCEGECPYLLHGFLGHVTRGYYKVKMENSELVTEWYWTWNSYPHSRHWWKMFLLIVVLAEWVSLWHLPRPLILCL